MANTLPNPLYVMLEGGQYLIVRNAVSLARVDVNYYDNSTYRKVVDASMLGNPHSFVTTRQSAQDGQTIEAFNYPAVPDAPENAGSPTSESLSLSVSVTYEPPILDGAINTYAPSVGEDSAFRVGSDDLVPGQTEKKQTFIQFYDEAGGAGNLVGEFVMSDFRSWTGAPPSNLN